MSITRLLLILLLLTQAATSRAGSNLVEDVRADFGAELYQMTSVAPGYRRPARNAPRFAVGDFRVDDESLKDWSQAIAEILTYRIQYAPGARLYMPAPYYRHIDAGINSETDKPLLTQSADFSRLRQSLGIDYVLTGEFSRGENDVLRVELVATGNGEVRAKKGWRFASERLPEVLILVSKWVYESLGVKLSPEEIAYLEDRNTLDYEAIEAFADNYGAIIRLEGRMKANKVGQLLEAHPDLPLLAVYAMHTRATPRDLDEAYRDLEANKTIRERFSPNAGVALESYRAIHPETLPKHDVSRNLDSLAKLVVANRQDPTFMINFADALIANGDAFKGLSVLLEAVDRWPRQYRAWWSLGWALNQLAWQIRGDSYWRDVPEQAKTEFTRLSEFADRAIDRALALNPRHPNLWGMKINTLGSRDGYTDELLETFDLAVAEAPHHRMIYANALHYSTANWGGHAAARLHILDTAEKNNPDAPWLEEMRKRHVMDLDNWEKRLGTSSLEIFVKELLDHPYGKYLALIIIVVVLITVYQMGRRST